MKAKERLRSCFSRPKEMREAIIKYKNDAELDAFAIKDVIAIMGET